MAGSYKWSVQGPFKAQILGSSPIPVTIRCSATRVRKSGARLVSGSVIINLPLGRANGTIRKSNVRKATDLKLLLNAQRIVEVRAFSGEYNNGLKIADKDKSYKTQAGDSGQKRS